MTSLKLPDRIFAVRLRRTAAYGALLDKPIIITMRVKADDHEGAIKKAKSLRHPDFRVDSCGRVWDN